MVVMALLDLMRKEKKGEAGFFLSLGNGVLDAMVVVGMLA